MHLTSLPEKKTECTNVQKLPTDFKKRTMSSSYNYTKKTLREYEQWAEPSISNYSTQRYHSTRTALFLRSLNFSVMLNLYRNNYRS
jgi:hypothetical protein